jgi:methionine--tRNA ligase beta chain
MSIKEIIGFDTLGAIDIRIGEIKTAEKVKKADRLIKMEVFFGDEVGTKTVMSSIAHKGFTPESLVSKKYPFVLNLEPMEIKKVLSEAMIVMSEDEDGNYNALPSEGSVGSTLFK